MKETRVIMGMPITVEIVDSSANTAALQNIFAYFSSVEERFSVYKDTSEISAINAGRISLLEASPEMRTIFALAEETKKLTDGFFDIHRPNGSIDPSGIVKGWAILQAATLLEEAGFQNFCVEAGGDIQVKGKNAEGNDWTIGIRNPFSTEEIVKVVTLHNQGMATSGTYIRGQHIYNPHSPSSPLTAVVSLTVIGANVYEADRFATAAFAMGKDGIHFIEQLEGFEGYEIDASGIATMTSGFSSYLPTYAETH